VRRLRSSFWAGQSPKRWRTNLIFLGVLWVILLIASLTILSSVITPFLKSLQTENVFSVVWAGYAVSSSQLAPQPLVLGVNGSWTVPKISASASDSYSAAWIGVGGQSDNTLVQCGTEHDFTGGQEQYSVWYEMLPADAVTVNSMRVSPGDKIKASITLADSATNTWAIAIDNLSSGQGFRQNFVYNSSQLSAEWIVERPTVNNQVTSLANFGNITFTEAKAQIDRTAGTISGFPNYEILMNNLNNVVLASVSSLSSDGSSFSVTYGQSS
jgi:hypothetical protein